MCSHAALVTYTHTEKMFSVQLKTTKKTVLEVNEIDNFTLSAILIFSAGINSENHSIVCLHLCITLALDHIIAFLTNITYHLLLMIYIP